MAEITKIEAFKPQLAPKKRVAGYARVSLEKGRTFHSLSAQVSYYNKLIQGNPDWVYAGVYSDSGISGTSKNRPGFQQLLTDCRDGKIDVVLTKSVSRFARNTVDLLDVVRELKSIGVEVRFEKERIHSLSEDGELMLTLLASFAEEEIRSISKNARWSVQKRFEQGIPNGRFRITGYDWEGDRLVINEEEAEIVRTIYRRYLEGASRVQIAKELNSEGITTINGKKWSDSNVKSILRNITFSGDLLLNKEYVADPITHERKVNKGERPQYLVENHHEPLISKEDWNAVQAEMKRRKLAGPLGNPAIPTTCFTSKIKCSKCGYNYRRHVSRRKNDDYPFWGCYGKDKNGTIFCDTGNIPEEALQDAVCEVLGLETFDSDAVTTQIDTITAGENRELVFRLMDGREVQTIWHYEKNARKAYWTKEVREKVSQERRNKHQHKLKNAATAFTGMIRCGNCGQSFSSTKRTFKDGTKTCYLSCRSPLHICPSNAIQEATLKALVCDVLELEVFDEAQMDAAIDYIEIAKPTATFHFFDGRIEKRTYHEKKKSYPCTPEQKEAMSAFMKTYWDDPEKRKQVSLFFKRLRKEKTWSSRSRQSRPKSSPSPSHPSTP
ncbi:recombinase family protein [Actinotignum urinale]|uniref:recombinase family protein n=1 Tax=Actinotignum urinale TaxID=190146 RepID=UPI0003B5E60D|nr:recombinase family protein [Actinotignum urinale]MDY5159629.1 recombinase family protein [Actinotignum urinale]